MIFDWAAVPEMMPALLSGLRVTVILTIVIMAIALRSLVLVTGVRRGARRAENVLRRADNLVEGR